MFLDNDQLVHLQAMANAQAHFVVQQPSAGVPAEGPTEDQQDHQGSYFNAYLQENYEPYTYYQGVSQEEINQYADAPDFPVYRGQLFPHQGPIDIEGRIAVHDVTGVSGNNGTSGIMGATGSNALVSSPSVEEELAQLQLADSDSDEPKHHNPDITAAAMNSNANNDCQDNNT